MLVFGVFSNIKTVPLKGGKYAEVNMLVFGVFSNMRTLPLKPRICVEVWEDSNRLKICHFDNFVNLYITYTHD